MEITDKVRCNNCMTVYHENKEICDKCQTDDYFMQPFNDGEGLKLKHTPGPWRYGAEKHCIPNAPIIQWGIFAGSTYLAGVPPENEADAALIAAAPELLEACKALVNAIAPDGKNQDVEPYFKEPLRLGFDAIAKAEGRS